MPAAWHVVATQQILFGWTDGQMDGRMDGWVDGRMDADLLCARQAEPMESHQSHTECRPELGMSWVEVL